MQPSRPQKVAKVVPTKIEPAVTPPVDDRYMRKTKVGQAPKIGTPVNRVSRVGLGGLRVITANGTQTPNTPVKDTNNEAPNE